MKFFLVFAISSFLPFFSLISQVAAHPASNPSLAASKKPLPLPVQVIHEFPHNTWVENLAVRSNGKILTTLLTSPDLYQIDPYSKKDPVLVHHFSDHLCLLGITETIKDVFYLAAGNYSVATSTNTPGAWDVYEVDLRKGVNQAAITKIANFPKAILLNGMTTLNAEKGLVLIADAEAGLIYKLNVKTGKVDIAIQDPTTAPATSGSPIAVNGLKICNGDLYFTNSGQHTFVKIPISATTGSATGPAVILSTNVEGDDFILDSAGDAFLAQNDLNNLAFLGSEGGEVTVLTGAPLTDKTLLAGPSACRFGRLERDREVLYITTTGGLASNATTPSSGGTLSRVDLGGSGYFDRGF